jgi:outer membrane receptor protein involved in Fe transport
VDYYNLDIAGAIGQLGSQRIVDDCSNGAQSLCALITRDPQTDLITDVADVFININQEVASGVDFEALYTTPVSWLSDGSEDLMLRGFVTYLAERATVLSGAEKDDQADDMLAGLPRWQGTGMISYTNGPFTFFVQERYIGGGKRDTNEVEGVDIDENDVESVWYTNLNASYEFGAGGATWEVFGHIANLFDADPPIVPEWSSFTGASQTVRSLYDLKGRRFVVGANIQF